MWKAETTIATPEGQEFYEKTEIDDARIKENLVDERVLAEAWFNLCNNQGTVTEAGLQSLEDMIINSVSLCWGICSFEIDRDNKIFIVQSLLDGRKMDLLTGTLL